MTLLLASMAFGTLPALRGSLVGVLFSAWILAAALSAAVLFGAIDLAGALPAVGMALLGFNAGVITGFGLNFAASVQPVRR